MVKEGWGPDLVRVIAGEVRRHRQRRKMSTQALSDACTQLGWEIKRTVLSNLESGYRETITVPELLILALALNVSPVELMVPLGSAQSVEIAPDTPVSTTEALLWITGQQALPGDDERGYQFEQETTHLVSEFQVHKTRVDSWRNARMYARLIRAGERKGTDEDIEDFERRAEQAVTDLRRIRRVMKAEGLLPPTIDDDLALAIEAQP